MISRPLRLPDSTLAAIRDHAREAYPDECCGFLVAAGDLDDGPMRQVERVERASNGFEGQRRRRFLIGADELRRAEERARAAGDSVVGFYHSHPDQPARPSQFDQDHAWPWYTYVVVAVTRGAPSEVRAFELGPDAASFRPVRIEVVTSEGGDP